MPAKNRIKQYVEDSIYHIYNRGVEKRNIFLNDQDYMVYLSFLKTYLEPKDEIGLNKILTNSQSNSKQRDQALKLLQLNNFSETIELIAFTLMPNHFHLCVHQKNASDIDTFMNSLSTRYSMYFNLKYKRVGPMYQGVYKAVRVNTDDQLLYLTKYIHTNPKEFLASQGLALRSWGYTSYHSYLGLRKFSWVKTDRVLSLLGKNGASQYEDFVETPLGDNEQILLNSVMVG